MPCPLFFFQLIHAILTSEHDMGRNRHSLKIGSRLPQAARMGCIHQTIEMLPEI